MKKSMFVGLIVLAALAISFTVSAAPVEIDYWGKWGGWFGNEVEDVIVAKFNEEYDGIYKVTAVEMDVMQKLPVAVAGNAAPGVVKVDRFRVGSYAAKALLQPIDSLIDRDGLDMDEFFPATRLEARFEGKTYGIPWNTDDRAMFYNVTIFNDAGLDPDNPPSTWEEVDVAARKIDQYGSDGELKRAGFFPHYGNWYFLGWLWAAGGRLLDETGRKVAWDSAEGLKAISWMVERLNRYGGEGAVSQCWSSAGGFEGGAVGMHMEGSWYPGHLNQYGDELDWLVANPPRPQELASVPITWSGGFALGIPAGVTGDEREAAWAFIRFYADHWAQKHLGVVSKGQMPALRSAATSDEFLDVYPEMTKFVYLMEDTKFRPVSPFGMELWSIYTDEIHALLREGAMSPQEILTTTASKAQAVLDEGWANLNK